MNIQKRIIIILCIGIISPLYPKFFGINTFQPWNINLRPERWPGKPFQITGYMEGGIKNRGYDADNSEVNVMQLWTPKQDAIAMLKGFGPDAPETDYFENVLMSPTDDGIRGNFCVAGDFNLKYGGGVAMRYNFCQCITIGAFLPFYSMKLSNICFNDLTKTANAEDILVRNDLTNNICQSVALFDPSLNLRGWNRSGLGDFAFTAEWLQSFPQKKPWLRNVDLNLRAGLTVPTGVKACVNDILSIPFGFDGSWGFFANGGINLNWWDHVRGGVDFLILHLFGNIRERRIKIQQDQTDFLFLAKARAHTDYGFTVRYNLFLEFYRIYRGFSAGAAYQFWRHAEDRLTLCSDIYSNAIANSAQNLEEWNIHQFIFMLKYNFICDLAENSFLNPELMFFYKMPVDGKRAILYNAAGVQLTFSF